MGRSPPLRVHSPRLNALFGLAFAAPSSRKDLSLPRTMTPGPIMQKVRRHFIKKLRPLVGNWFQVLFHSPNRGPFHLSLTVVFSHPQWSAQIHTGFHVSRATQEHPRSFQVFGYRSITFYGSSFQMIHLTFKVPHWGPTTPTPQAESVWAGPVSLAATWGIEFSFFSSAY